MRLEELRPHQHDFGTDEVADLPGQVVGAGDRADEQVRVGQVLDVFRQEPLRAAESRLDRLNSVHAASCSERVSRKDTPLSYEAEGLPAAPIKRWPIGRGGAGKAGCTVPPPGPGSG